MPKRISTHPRIFSATTRARGAMDSPRTSRILALREEIALYRNAGHAHTAPRTPPSRPASAQSFSRPHSATPGKGSYRWNHSKEQLPPRAITPPPLTTPQDFTHTPPSQSQSPAVQTPASPRSTLQASLLHTQAASAWQQRTSDDRVEQESTPPDEHAENIKVRPLDMYVAGGVLDTSLVDCCSRDFSSSSS